jgi:hypothetical protein
MPTIEEEVPEPYTREQIESLFAYLDREGLQEEKQRYKFFLGSSLREKEVMFAEWDDIDLTGAPFVFMPRKMLDLRLRITRTAACLFRPI